MAEAGNADAMTRWAGFRGKSRGGDYRLEPEVADFIAQAMSTPGDDPSISSESFENIQRVCLSR